MNRVKFLGGLLVMVVGMLSGLYGGFWMLETCCEIEPVQNSFMAFVYLLGASIAGFVLGAVITLPGFTWVTEAMDGR